MSGITTDMGHQDFHFLNMPYQVLRHINADIMAINIAINNLKWFV